MGKFSLVTLALALALLSCEQLVQIAGTAETCGNAIIELAEQCDEGESNSNFIPNACRADCTNARCGDGTLDSGEGCDDENTTDGDGCSSTCEAEGNALGCRAFTFSTGADGTPAADGHLTEFYSAYLSSLTGSNFDNTENALIPETQVEGWKAVAPLTLCAGEPDSDGKATVTVQSDIIVAFQTPLSYCGCRVYRAGSSGSLYCGPHTDSLDFLSSVDSEGASSNSHTATHIESDVTITQEGTLRLELTGAGGQYAVTDDAPCSVDICEEWIAAGGDESYTGEVMFRYTTGTATSEVLNAMQGGEQRISASGLPFDDDPDDGVADCEDWQTPSGRGVLAGAAEFRENISQLPNTDVALVERIAEAAVAP